MALLSACAETVQASGTDAAAVATAPDAGPNALIDLAMANDTCALRADGAVLCWGGWGATGLDLRARAVAVGASRACVIDADGLARCDVDGAVRASFSVVEGPRDVVGLALGGFTACFVARGGAVWCGRANERVAVARAPALDNTRDISVGWGFACGLRGEGEVWCWSTEGAQPSAHLPADGTPRRVATGARAVAVGASVACILDATGAVACWPQADLSVPPTAVPGMTGVTRVAAGYGLACALRADGAWCWGINGYGQRGVGDTAERAEPTRVLLDAPVEEIAVGHVGVCARGGARAWCWGYNGEGQLGLPGERVRMVTRPAEVSLPL